MHRAASKPKEAKHRKSGKLTGNRTIARILAGEAPPGDFDENELPEPPAPTFAESVQLAANELELASLNDRGGTPDSGHRLLQSILMVAYQLAGIRDELAILREIEEDRAEQDGV